MFYLLINVLPEKGQEVCSNILMGKYRLKFDATQTT